MSLAATLEEIPEWLLWSDAVQLLASSKEISKIPQLRAKGTKKEKDFEIEFKVKLHNEKWAALFKEREANRRFSRRSRRPSCTDSGESTPVYDIGFADEEQVAELARLFRETDEVLRMF